MAKIFEHDESRIRERERRKHIEARTQRPYRASSPVTPIPRRASASSPGSVRVRVRHPRTYHTEFQEEDCSRLPTVPQSATWQGEGDEYEGENDQAVLPLGVSKFSPFLPSSLSIDELDTVPPDDDHDIAPARLTDYAASAPSGAYTIQFPLDIAGPAQQVQAGLQFPLEAGNSFQSHRNNLRFPLELDEGPGPRGIHPGFPLELNEEPEPRGMTPGFSLEPGQGPEPRGIHPGFPLEMGEIVLKGNDHVASNRAMFPVVWPDERDGGQIERAPLNAVKNGRADISELATNPPPAPVQPHSVLALHNEASYVDAVVEADTVMDDTLIVVPSLSTDIALYETRVEDIVDIALTARAKQLLRHKGSVEDTPAFIHNPLDYMRWWLLSPGRLEFLFWLGGALLLGVVMCVVLVVTGLGLGWMSFGHLAH